MPGFDPHQIHHSPYKNKIVTAAEAVQLVHDGDTVATGGYVGIGFAEGVAVALEERFLASQHPRELTLVYAAARATARRAG